MAIKKDSAGVEDIIFGMGTRVQLRKGSEVVITELNGTHIPYSETQSTNQKIDEVDSKIEAPTNGLNNHVADKGNPHEVTADQVGAEHDLGLPAQEGYILSSHANGVREWVAPPEGTGGGSVAWGDITGLLSQQTDLVDEFATKADAQALTDHEGATNPHSITLSGLGGEPDLDVPSVDGQVLASTVAGVRSWVTMTAGGGGDGVWGAITGDINAQTDLQNQFDTKEDHLGNPTTNGYALVSQIDGSRSWSPRTAVISWGSITGLLSQQTDLQGELNAKFHTSGDTITGDSHMSNSADLLFDYESNLIFSSNGSNGYSDQWKWKLSDNTSDPDLILTWRDVIDNDKYVFRQDGLSVLGADVVVSDTTETGAKEISNIVEITQADYDALTPVANTVYFIVG